jgi:hypothetical protein
METVPPERMPGELELVRLAQIEIAIDDLIANSKHAVRVFDKSVGRSFNTAQRCALLRDLLLASRSNRVYIALHETSNIVRDCPRLVNLLRQFSHSMFIYRTLPAARQVYDPFVIGDDLRFVHRFHYDRPRGAAVIGDLTNTTLMLRRFEEIWSVSAPAICATTIGL